VFAAEISHRTSTREDPMSKATVTEGDASRIDVGSSDGTHLAVWVEGSGPALVMVHGSIADHTTFDPFVEVLRDNLTTFSMDRRGFGASGDGDVYAIERDFDDVATVIDTVAASASPTHPVRSTPSRPPSPEATARKPP
jgi:pimeloyl-ACP methyl ester carboxylesterase